MIQRIESGARFITDIELRIIADVLNVTDDELLEEQAKVISALWGNLNLK